MESRYNPGLHFISPQAARIEIKEQTATSIANPVL